MTEDLELTPRYRLIERIQQLETNLSNFFKAVDVSVGRIEKLTDDAALSKASKKAAIKDLIKMGLLGKERGKPGPKAGSKRGPYKKKKKRVMSPEARAKISAAKKAYWAKKNAGK